ncbi:MAG: response regulator transcription factor [Bacteroidales bacterium]|nr:response regulator transcription factor [Bacteroidales bacterium]
MNSSEKPVKVLIADNQFLITESLKIILQNDARFIVFKVVTEKDDLNKALKQDYASLLIIDPSLIDFTSLSELKEIKSSFPDLKLLVITNSVSKIELHDLNTLGIINIILKTATKEEIFDVLDAVLKGKKYYSNELLEILFEVDKRKNLVEETVLLTSSELEIVRLISEGLTTKEIASRKFISFHTVITHRKNIFRKLSVSSVSELIMCAIKAGWINNIEYYI